MALDYTPRPIAPLFPTLASVGFRKCDHPRVNRTATTPYCQDCGAAEGINGSLDFVREPLGQ